MKKIFLFSNSFDKDFGGMEEHRNAFVNYFNSDKDFNLLLVTNKHNEYKILVDNEKYLFNDLCSFINQLKMIVHTNDIFFFNDFRWINEIPLLKKYFINVSFIIRSGGNDIFRAPVLNDKVNLSVRQKKLVEIINNNINCLIVNSDYSFIANRNLGINPLIMKKIRGGVDFEQVKILLENKKNNRMEFDKINDTYNFKLITIACRFVPFKGVIEFLDQIKNSFNYKTWKLLVIGTGILYNEIKLKLEKDFPNNYILIPGENHYNTLKYLSISDYVVNPSLYYKRYFKDEWYYHTETMGRTMIEAISLNVPIIATNVGGTSELFFECGNKIGLLVENFLEFDVKIESILSENLNIDYKMMYDWKNIFEKYKLIFDNNKKDVFCFDIDGTILNKQTIENDVYSELEKRGDKILILNTARKKLSEVENFFKNSNADYLIYNNGQNIISKDNKFYTNKYFEDFNFVCDLNKIYTDYVKLFGNHSIEITHVNCLSILKNTNSLNFCKRVINKYNSIELIIGNEFLKLISKKVNKLQGLLFICKDIPCIRLIVAGDATNDVPFLNIGDIIYSSESINNLISKEPRTFKKDDDKINLIRRIYNE